MKQSDLRDKNTEIILNCIINGINTAHDISDKTGISIMTISKIIRILLQKNILSFEYENDKKLGRKTKHYLLLNDYYSIYIEEKKEVFSTLLINTKGNAVFRYDYLKNKLVSEQKNFSDLMDYIFKYNNISYCVACFFECSNHTSITGPIEIEMLDKSDFIIKYGCINNEDKIIYYEINGEEILCIYGHEYLPKVSIYELERCIPIDEKKIYGNSYYPVFFEALKNRTISAVVNKIKSS